MLWLLSGASHRFENDNRESAWKMLHTGTARTRARTLALVGLGILVLGGCGASPQDNTADTQAAETSSSASPSPERTDTGSAKPTSTATPTTSSNAALPEDWRPEEPTVLATGQKVPDDYEPATLEHPARNVPKPVMPPEAKEETEAGAQAFLNYRADAQWYAFQTGDTSLVRDVTSSSCDRCFNQFTRIEENYASGSWMAGGAESSHILPNSFQPRASGEYTLPIDARSSGVIVIDDGKIVNRQEPYSRDNLLDVSVIRKGQSWIYITASPRGSL
ncbi:hypothetical protein ABH921_000796 [Kocuria sp. MT07]